MTKAQIHFSNDIDALISVLKETLFPEGSAPFDKRLIAVAHMALKERICLALAADPDMQVAAGMQIVTIDQAYTKLTGQRLPSMLELSLFLQHELLGIIERFESLHSYFSMASKEERIGPFCDALASYFLLCKVYGKPELPTWQEELYSRLPWIFPANYRGKINPYALHLFGFSHVSRSAFSFFERAGATFYLFSPCAIFWGDFFSDKESAAVQKEIGQVQLSLLSQMGGDQNPLLANWGKVGRQLQIMIEQTQVPTWEHYVADFEPSALGRLKKAFLEGVSDRPCADDSIQVVSATSRLREVEILKDTLLGLFAKGDIAPSDVQVVAPDIDVYAPLIEAVFDDIDVTIEGVRAQRVDPLCAAFDQLIALQSGRFHAEDLLQLLPHLRGDFDVGQIRRWVEAASIRWGFSKASREAHYMQDLEPSDLHVLCAQGTWVEGFRRLILGLGQSEGDALAIVGIAEMEAFDAFYRLVVDLADDLCPLLDGTRWTIPTWLRYLACLMQSYLPIDPSHHFYCQLLQLASQTDHLDQVEVPFEGIRRVLDRARSQSLVASHLQAIRFCSAVEGGLVPSKVIAFLGAEEGAFPRGEPSASLRHGELDFCPKRADTDRYLFLQALLLAKRHFYASYVRDSKGQKGASLLIEQLLGELEGSLVVHHPVTPVDPRYFGGDLTSYDQHAYALLKAQAQAEPHPPLIPSFYGPVSIERADLLEISVKKLAKFARHPLRYHLHEVLGIYPTFDSKDAQDYLLDPQVRSSLVMERLAGREIKAHLPLNLFEPLALSQIDNEVELWREATGGQPLTPHPISLSIGPYHIKGVVETATQQGWFFRAKDSLEDRVRYLPLLLLASVLKIPVTFIRDQSRPEVRGSLEAYLDYFAHAQHHPSPMLPGLAKGLLAGDASQVAKGLRQLDDEVWTYLRLRDSLPQPEVLLKTWQPHIERAFEGV